MDEETDLEEDQEPKQQEYMRHPFQDVPKPKSTIPIRKYPMDIMKEKGKKIQAAQNLNPLGYNLEGLKKRQREEKKEPPKPMDTMAMDIDGPEENKKAPAHPVLGIKKSEDLERAEASKDQGMIPATGVLYNPIKMQPEEVQQASERLEWDMLEDKTPRHEEVMVDLRVGILRVLAMPEAMLSKMILDKNGIHIGHGWWICPSDWNLAEFEEANKTL